jgi:hypothetical protein
LPAPPPGRDLLPPGVFFASIALSSRHDQSLRKGKMEIDEMLPRQEIAITDVIRRTETSMKSTQAFSSSIFLGVSSSSAAIFSTHSREHVNA